MAGGIDDGKIKRVVGMASAVLMDASDSASPVNRRIAIIVLTRQAEEALDRDSGAQLAAGTGGSGNGKSDGNQR